MITLGRLLELMAPAPWASPFNTQGAVSAAKYHNAKETN